VQGSKIHANSLFLAITATVELENLSIDEPALSAPALQVAARESVAKVAHAVRRLTREPAEFFGIDAGRLDIGAQADVALIDPQALLDYDTDANRRMIYRDIFEYEQLVNRSDGVVTSVFIAGERVWDGREILPVLGTRKLGRPLTAGTARQAVAAA